MPSIPHPKAIHPAPMKPFPLTAAPLAVRESFVGDKACSASSRSDIRPGDSPHKVRCASADNRCGTLPKTRCSYARRPYKAKARLPGPSCQAQRLFQVWPAQRIATVSHDARCRIRTTAGTATTGARFRPPASPAGPARRPSIARPGRYATLSVRLCRSTAP